MAKFYRIIKDHPLWETGAIISNADAAGEYRPVSDLFVKDIAGAQITETWFEGAALVENQTEWFERVYESKLMGKVKYLAKEEARKALSAQYK